MDMIRKGRVRRVAKGNTVEQVKFIGQLFGIAAQTDLLIRKFCSSGVFATNPSGAIDRIVIVRRPLRASLAVSCLRQDYNIEIRAESDTRLRVTLTAGRQETDKSP